MENGKMKERQNKGTQYNERNISMVMDMYELTMSNGYFNNGNQDTLVAFDVFYRKNPDDAGFSIFAGLEQVVEYIQDMHFSEEDGISAFQESVYGGISGIFAPFPVQGRYLCHARGNGHVSQ